jgi:hypothetical protein
VSSVLRDENVEKLCRDNEMLRQKLKGTRAVTITGPEGTPVYCRGQLDEGALLDDNPNLWRVNLSSPLVPCRLADLDEVEVRIGGMVKALLSDNTEGILYDEAYNEETRQKPVHFYFDGAANLWLTVFVGPLSRAESAVLEQIDAQEMIPGLYDLFEKNEEAALEFDHVSFITNGVSGALENLGHEFETI